MEQFWEESIQMEIPLYNLSIKPVFDATHKNDGWKARDRRRQVVFPCGDGLVWSKLTQRRRRDCSMRYYCCQRTMNLLRSEVAVLAFSSWSQHVEETMPSWSSFLKKMAVALALMGSHVVFGPHTCVSKSFGHLAQGLSLPKTEAGHNTLASKQQHPRTQHFGFQMSCSPHRPYQKRFCF